MMCQRIGIPPISTIGLGRYSVSSRIRVPLPPHRMTACKLPPVASRSLPACNGNGNARRSPMVKEIERHYITVDGARGAAEIALLRQAAPGHRPTQGVVRFKPVAVFEVSIPAAGRGCVGRGIRGIGAGSAVGVEEADSAGRRRKEVPI